MRSTALTWASTVFGEIESSQRDLLVEVAAGDQPQDLALAGGELVELGVGLGLGDLPGEGVEHETREARREDGVAVAHPGDRLGELGAGDRLGHVAAGAGADDRDHVLGRVGDRQGQEALRGFDSAVRRITSTPPPPGMWTSSRTTSGRSAGDHPHGLLDRAGVAADLDQALELGADAAAEDRVVVDDHDARRGGAHLGSHLHRQLDLGAGAGRRVDRRGAAVALHPADDRLAQPAAVGGHGVGVEARAAVADEDLRPLRPRSRRRRRSARRRRRTSPRS